MSFFSGLFSKEAFFRLLKTLVETLFFLLRKETGKDGHSEMLKVSIKVTEIKKSHIGDSLLYKFLRITSWQGSLLRDQQQQFLL